MDALDTILVSLSILFYCLVAFFSYKYGETAGRLRPLFAATMPVAVAGGLVLNYSLFELLSIPRPSVFLPSFLLEMGLEPYAIMIEILPLGGVAAVLWIKLFGVRRVEADPAVQDG